MRPPPVDFTKAEATLAFALVAELDPDGWAHPETKALILKVQALGTDGRARIR